MWTSSEPDCRHLHLPALKYQPQIDPTGEQTRQIRRHASALQKAAEARATANSSFVCFIAALVKYVVIITNVFATRSYIIEASGATPETS